MDYNDLEGFRNAGGLAAALVDFQEPPADYHKDILTDLRRILTASGNPHKNTQPNQLFQADLDKDCLVDELFKRTPTVDVLARLMSARITLWQKDKAFNVKRYETNPRDDASEAPPKKPRHDENSRHASILAAV